METKPTQGRSYVTLQEIDEQNHRRFHRLGQEIESEMLDSAAHIARHSSKLWWLNVPTQGVVRDGAEWVCERMAADHFPVALVGADWEQVSQMCSELGRSYNDLQEKLNLPGRWNYDPDLRRVMLGLGNYIYLFSASDVRIQFCGRAFMTAWCHDLADWGLRGKDNFQALHFALRGDLMVTTSPEVCRASA